jgi:hypothetical protein
MRPAPTRDAPVAIARRSALVSILLAIVAIACSPSTASADTEWLGFARRIPRSWSASRDTPAFNLLVLPRDVRSAGAELAMFTWRGAATSVRTGFAGLIELESDGETEAFGNLFPRASGVMLWRGAYAYYVALSLDRVGERLCAGCVVELSGQYRHESQHYTGSNAGDPGMDVRDEPYVGDDAIVDGALLLVRGDWLLTARAIAFAFLPGRSSYAGGPALDLHARWRGARVQPFVSAYAEELFGTELEGHRFDNAYLVRALAGVALPSKLGDVMIYMSADAGNRKGIRGNTEEATLGLGVRLALGAAHRSE